MSRDRAGALAVGAVAFLLTGSGAAIAMDGPTAFSVQVSDAGLLPQVPLFPGQQVSGSMVIRNGSELPAEVTMVVGDLRGSENGCLPKEQTVATEGCDADGGELQDVLLMTCTDTSGTRETVYDGRLADFTQLVSLTGQIPPGGAREVVCDLTLPFTAGDDTMTDRAEFAVVVTATAGPEQGEIEVGGGDVSGPDGDGDGGGPDGDGDGGLTPPPPEEAPVDGGGEPADEPSPGGGSPSGDGGLVIDLQPDGPGDAPDAAADEPGSVVEALPATGSSVSTSWPVLGAGLLGGGAAMVAWGRRTRRRSATSSA